MFLADTTMPEGVWQTKQKTRTRADTALAFSGRTFLRATARHARCGRHTAALFGMRS